MVKGRVREHAKPMFLSRRDEDDIPLGYQLLFLLRGHDSLSGGDDQDLFAVVGMKLVPHPLPEVYHVHAALFAVGHQNLSRHIMYREDRIGKRLLGYVVQGNDFHLFLPRKVPTPTTWSCWF